MSNEIARLLFDTFRGREDAYAIQSERPLADGKYSFTPVERALRVEDLADSHLAAKRGLGFYVLTKDSKCWVSAADFDDHEDNPNPGWRDEAIRVWTWLAVAGLDPILELSQSGKGAHVWLIHAEPIDAWLVRAFWRLVERQSGVKLAEIFPKQDRLGAKGYGNLIRFPFWNKSRFVDTEWADLDPSATIRSTEHCTAEQLRDVAADLGVALNPLPESGTATESAAPVNVGTFDINPGAKIPDKIIDLAETLVVNGEPKLRALLNHERPEGDTTLSGYRHAVACTLAHLKLNVAMDITQQDIADTLVGFCRKWARDDAHFRKNIEPRQIRRDIAGAIRLARSKPTEEVGPADTHGRNNGEATKTTEREPAKTNKPEPPTPIEPYKPFPTEVLPDPVAAFVRGASKAIGCDPAFVALPTLAALASTIGASRRIQLKRGWPEPCVIWALIVAESGTLKSPAIDVALEPIRAEQRAAFKRHGDAMAEYGEAAEAYAADLAEWKKKGRKSGEPQPEKPQEPACERFIVADTTVEALAARLEENPRGLLLARDELAGWLKSFDAYKGGKGGDCAHWLEMHRAGELIVDRKTGDRKVIYCPRAAVSITGGVQPEILRDALGREHHQDGLAARLLLAMPPRRDKRWTESEVSFADRDRMARLTRALIDLPVETDGDGYLRPIDIQFSEAGKAAWIPFYHDFAAEQAMEVGDIAAAYSKIEGYAARLALLIHVIRSCWAGQSPDTEIDARSVGAGVTLARWFAQEVRRVYIVMADTTKEANHRKLIEWITRKGGDVTPSEVLHGIWGIKTAADAKESLNALIDGGLGGWYHPPVSSKGGRPSQRFRLLAADAITNTLTDGAVEGLGYGDARGKVENTPHVETSAERERLVI